MGPTLIPITRALVTCRSQQLPEEQLGDIASAEAGSPERRPDSMKIGYFDCFSGPGGTLEMALGAVMDTEVKMERPQRELPRFLLSTTLTSQPVF
ncbi:MAG: hypothetical protein ACOC7Y_00685 [Chloroflexota bacterium]